MIALLLAVTQFLVVGTAVALRLDPAMPPRRLLGAAYLFGSGVCAFVLLAFSVLGIPWTAVSFTAAFCAVTVALWMPMLLPLLRRPPRPVRAPAPRQGMALAIDAGTLLLVIAHGAYTLAARGRVWDFWAIWGLKARVFFLHGGIDWAFLRHPDHAFAHPDYPPLLPLNYVQVALLEGRWSENALGLLSTLFAAALLLIVRDCFEEEFRRPVPAALATLAVASLSFTLAGIADAPMIAYGTAGLLMVRRGSFAAGSVLLGLAAFTKNEGVALIVAAALALLAWRRSAVLRLWPAAVVAAPWLILRAVHTLPTDIAAGNLAGRARSAVVRVPELARAIAENPENTPLLWLGVAVALVAYARRLHRERFLLLAVVIQAFFYLGAYLVTPYEVRLHVAASWARIVPHLALPAAFVALTLTSERAGETE